MHLKRHSNLAVAIAIVLVLICTILSFIPDARAGFSNRAIATTRAGLIERIVSLSNDPTGGTSNIDIHHIHSSSRNRKLRVGSSEEKGMKAQLATPERTASNSSSNPTSSDNISVGRTATGSITQHRPLFPKSVWFAIFFLYHIRRCAKRRQPTYEVNWFVKSVDCRLNHYGVEEYKRDFLSVDSSNYYGSMSKWNGEELNKFDV